MLAGWVAEPCDLPMKARSHFHSRGVALVIVLSFLILISVIILAFFSSVSTELTNSKAVANSATTHQLADSAVNVVMAQLVDATKGQDSSNATLAWASQPGMIRTFDTTGQAKDFFKLYSSDQMTADGGSFDAKAEVPPTDWNTAANSELYTDLNAPGVDSQGLPVYPIVDPAADGTKPVLGQPIDLKVEGFSITSPPGYNSSKDNRAPMPVKWLYVLKDGTLKPGSGAGVGNINVIGATTANPIVGRIAFWADDETAKVNINTASEGVYWDTPRIFSPEDVGASAAGYSPGAVASTPGLGLCQPANREYQRYPGHPATTSLSPIFGSLLASPVPAFSNNYAAITPGNAAQLDPYYNIAPRIGMTATGGVAQGGGGSNGGTRIPAAMTLDTDRLYASVDELMFTPVLTTTGSPPSRVPNTAANSKNPKTITKGVLEKARFFITANSSAPEVTLYNTPRIGIWPVNVDPLKQTAFDKLAAFCGTIGSNAGNDEYYFTREDARSATKDFTPRNQTLYKYLQALTSKAVPGFGGKFSDKYPAGSDGVTDCDQILTSIYDYIRCVNLSDTSTGAKPFTPLTNFNNKNLASTAGAGEVIPIRINNTQGFGRFDTVAELDLLFHGTHKFATSNRADKMKAVVMMKFGSPMQGNVGYQPNLKYRITGLDTLKITDAKPEAVSLNLPNDATNIIEVPDNQTCHGRSFGGIEGPAMAFTNKPLLDRSTNKRLTTSGGELPGNYPFFSKQEIALGFADSVTTFALSAGTIKVEVIAVDTKAIVQTLTFKIPKTDKIKIPDFNNNYSDFNKRLSTMQTDWGNWTLPIQNEDTVIGLELAGTKGNDASNTTDNTAGDLRMVAARQTVADSFFRPHLDWSNTMSAKSPGKAYGLIASLGLRYPGATSGALVANANYMNGDVKQPGIPSRVPLTDGVRRADGKPGDWDTGVGLQKDGAYMNKADEGDQQFTNYLDGSGRIPYITKDDFFQADGTAFSPNRQVPSSMMFGGIPTGVQRNLPWQTLLFHPRPEDISHPGKASPPDHLLADLFWMPIVEPWAISQPFATMGKINMNYQIVPFTYIQRSTGLQAVMKGTKFMALQVGDATSYKPHITSIGQTPNASLDHRRYSIDMAKTLADFDTKFKNNEVFKSATQICEMNLIPPQVAGSPGMAAFWNNNQLTGDNLREKPYVDIYPRLTTKSNTYTVHVRVQALKKAPVTPANPADKWDASKDKVVGEYRGSSILERYIDVNDPLLPDFATKFANNPNDSALNIDQYYKMRVVSTKRFAP